MTQKSGRPPIANPKDKMIRVRMDKETAIKLEECAKAMNTSQSEVIRKGINMIADKMKAGRTMGETIRE